MGSDTTATFQNLADAFARDAQTLIRYRHFASTARHEGYPAIAALFERLAQNQLVLVQGHFDFLREATDPLSGLAFGSTKDNMRAALVWEREEAERLFASAARVAASEDYPSIAAWFQSSLALKKSHIGRIEDELRRAGLGGTAEENVR